MWYTYQLIQIIFSLEQWFKFNEHGLSLMNMHTDELITMRFAPNQV